MAYSAMSTQVNGYLVTATDWNQIVNNFAATGVGTVTTSGDMTYATGANALTRCAIGSTNQFLMVVGGVPTWQAIPTGNVPHTAQTLYLTSDVNFNNTTIFGNITGLTFSIAANEVWSISLYLYVTYTSAQAFKLAVNGPAAPTSVSAQAMAISPTASVFAAGNATAYDTAFVNNTAIGSSAVIVGGILIRNGANAGTIAMRGAQAAAAVNNTAFKAGSYIRIQRES